MIVNKGGRAALNFEHSWGDGICILRFMNEVYDDSMRSTFQPEDIHDAVRPMSQVTKLEFKLDANNIQAIRSADEKFQKTVESLTIEKMEYTKYGRDFIKSQDLGPDAIMQLSFQVNQCLLVSVLPAVLVNHSC